MSSRTGLTSFRLHSSSFRYELICSNTSRPPMSATPNGPRAAYRRPSPAFITVSTSSSVAAPVSTMCNASRNIANCSRFITNPFISLTTTGLLPSSTIILCILSTVSCAVSFPTMISQSGKRCGGLSQCCPTKRDGFITASAMSVI